jgi:NADH-quinone oxidoreductase subunit L
VAIFHLMTHAFFKALLFLAAGSVIIGMHHDQDIRHMGGLRRYMPITWITSLVGSLALIGTPFLSGFYSKDSIIEAVAASHIPGAGFAHFAVLAGVFVTAFYSFRMYFLVFHGKERFAQHGGGHDDHGHDDHGHGHGGTPHESPWVVTLPLVMLAIPSLIIGHLAIGPMLFGDYFAGVIHIAEVHEAMAHLREHFHGAAAMSLHALSTAPFWLAAAGVALAWWFYLKRPDIPAAIAARVRPVHTLLLNKYYFDELYNAVFAGGSRLLGRLLWRVGDVAIIDGLVVNGAARTVGWFSTIVRKFQSGLIYHYAFTMIIGVFVLLTIWFVRT